MTGSLSIRISLFIPVSNNRVPEGTIPMSDSEQHYPYHHFERDEQKRHLHPSDEDDVCYEHEEGEEGEQADYSEHGSIHQYQQEDFLVLPRHGVRKALIAGVIGGVLAVIVSIVVTIANTSTYNSAGTYPAAKLPLGLAYTLVGLGFLTFLISLLIYLITGFVMGRIVVLRRFGFLAGAIAGIITRGISFLLNYIPTYPGSISTSGTVTNSTNAGFVLGGIGVTLLLLAVWAIIGGLTSLLGSWLATRRHAYYTG